MKVILLDKVENLGNLGDLVSVKPGYGRNYLIPSGRAAPATEENIRVFEQRRAELERTAADALERAQARAERLSGMSVSVARKAGEEGRLFGSVGNTDVAEALTAAGVEVRKQEVRMPEGPIRQIGSYAIQLHLHPEVNASVTLEVIPE